PKKNFDTVFAWLPHVLVEQHELLLERTGETAMTNKIDVNTQTVLPYTVEMERKPEIGLARTDFAGPLRWVVHVVQWFGIIAGPLLILQGVCSAQSQVISYQSHIYETVAPSLGWGNILGDAGDVLSGRGIGDFNGDGKADVFWY